ncbi:MAG: hypothetical protein J0L82_12680 [Deltaproteobacteria bacterium]|jgi:hypothetical protein|nr:hypothetical protein [Deltaproteobacteria bacterium]
MSNRDRGMAFRTLIHMIFNIALLAVTNLNVAAAHTDEFYSELKNVPRAMEQYESTKEAVIDLMERFPPDKYVYVGIGKSPTPIIAFIKAIGGAEAAQSLPLTGIGPHGSFKKNEPQSIAKLHQHLSEFLPNIENLGGKKLVILDFADSATSLEFAAQEIRNFLDASYPQQKIELEVVGIPNWFSAKRLRTKGFHVLKVNRDLRRSLTNHEYKSLHEFEDYDDSPSSPYKRPARRSTEFLKDKARNTKYIVNGVSVGPPAEVLAAKERDISVRRGFDNLVFGYQQRAANDRKLIKLLQKKHPVFFGHLSSIESIPPVATTSTCIRWFQALISAPR